MSSIQVLGNSSTASRSLRPGTSILVAFLAGCVPASAAEPPPRFESDLRPLFQVKCFACHSAQAKQGGLSLETRDDVLHGGKTGAAAVPGRPSDSILLGMVISGKMPMGGPKLTDSEITLLRRWIETGALAGREDTPVKFVSEREIFTSILGAKCFACHGRRMQKAGLDMRSRANLLKGGKSGPAMVPGKPDQSLIVKRIAGQEMPPPHLQEQFSVRGLTEDEFAKLKTWIANGAPADNEQQQSPDPNHDPLVTSKDRQHWAFRTPARPAVPVVRNSQAVRNPIDAFLLARLEEKNLAFAAPAPPLALLRRVTLDLTGLPPKPDDVNAFLSDTSPDAYEKVVDRLLASPRYGERWGKYWLDAAGYADSEGAVSADNVRHFAWRYRDYVIRSLNQDKPYDLFLTEQIAGDEMFDYKGTNSLTPDQLEKLIATGFMRMAPDSTYSTEQNFIPERFDTIAGQIEILGTSVMGLTVGCARCHDHKYDPIPQRDYYRLTAVLATSYDPYDWLAPSMDCVGVGAKCDETNTRFLPFPSSEEREQAEKENAPVRKRIQELEAKLEAEAAPHRETIRAERLAQLPEAIRKDLLKASTTPETERSETQKYLIEKLERTLKPEIREIADRFEDFRKLSQELQAQIRAERAKLKPAPEIRALFDMGGEPTPNRVLLRGDPANPGPLVAPGGLSVLSASIPPYRIQKPAYHSGTTGRRLALAKWLTHPDHPLTARVMVNRMWQDHFGVGLVSNPANFGRTGPPPSDPELLDWLATELVRQRWSLKAIHRLMVTSNAYRQDSRVDDSRKTADPNNRLLSRFPMRRMDADALYDSMLSVAERLDEAMYGPPAEIKVQKDGEVISTPGKHGYRRAIYLQQRRSKPVTMLQVFDAPLLSPNCVKRGQSTVSLQALQMVNSTFVREIAGYIAGRLIDRAGEQPEKLVERVYQTIYSRRPSQDEQDLAVRSLMELRDAWRRELQAEKPAEPIAYKAQWEAVRTLCHTLLNSAEFMYAD